MLTGESIGMKILVAILVHLAGRLLLLTEDVAARFTDSGKDFTGNPVLKLTSLRFVGAHDEFVKTAFGGEYEAMPLECNSIQLNQGEQNLTLT